jgi:hypothetical protein
MPSDAVFFLIRHSGYFESTSFINDARKTAGISGAGIQFYDSNTGKLLFVAPQNRTLEEFLVESRAHGWPSFRGKFDTLMRTDRMVRFFARYTHPKFLRIPACCRMLIVIDR